MLQEPNSLRRSSFQRWVHNMYFYYLWMLHMFFRLEYGLSVLIGEVIPEMKLQKHSKELLPQSNPSYSHLLL